MQVQKQIDELLALRASEWVEILPTASEEQLRALDVWLGESRLHVQEFLEVAEVELSLARLDVRRHHDVDALLAGIASRIAPLPARPAAGPFVTSSLRSWRRHSWKIAAGCAGLALASFLYMQLAGSNRYATRIGEQRTVELADASLITLNTDSEIVVRLDDSRREIELRRGEAIFKVAQDSRRPFRVRTQAGLVQAIGTQFNVHERFNGDTSVSVLEGRVRAISTAGAELMLAAGEEADMRLDGTIRRKENPAVSNAVAWRQHRLVFNGAPLEEMVAEFNRYNQSVRLRLEGLEGDPRRYDGVFEATDPASLANLLAREADLVLERKGNEIVIRRAGSD